MKVEFNAALKRRTIAFCEDELNYHIHESGCANEYHDETCAEIELLYRLGEKDMAEEFKDAYLKWLVDEAENVYASFKKRVKTLIKEFEKFWDSLTGTTI